MNSSTGDFDNIWVASTEGNIEKVMGYIASGVSINAQDEFGFSPLHAATQYGHINLLEYLLSNGADVNIRDADGDTALLVCENQACFELLERHGADINAKNNDGGGFPEKAVELADEGNEDMVTFLFNRGLIPVNFRMMVQENEEQELAEGQIPEEASEHDAQGQNQ